MKEQEMREILIEATIHTIAHRGLDKTTTKAIATHAQLNEAYMFRIFGNKEGLLISTFTALDQELLGVVSTALAQAETSSLSQDERIRAVFKQVWQFMLANEDCCLAYIRYYYSPYYVRCSEKDQQERYQAVAERFTPYLLKKANAWLLITISMDIMLSLATRIFSGQMENNDKTEEWVLQLVKTAAEPFLLSQAPDKNKM